MLIIYVAVSLLFGGPSNLVVFAGRYRALPGTGVRLLVLPVEGVRIRVKPGE